MYSHTHLCTFSIQFRKVLQERRLQLSTFSQDNPENNFLNFLTLWKYFPNLAIFRGFSNRNWWDFLLIFWIHCFIIIEICQKINICYRQIIHFSHKNDFPIAVSLKIFSLNMFPKRSLVTRNIATLGEHSANIPRILHASWLYDMCLFFVLKIFL